MPTPYESARLSRQRFELRREPVLREALRTAARTRESAPSVPPT